MNFTVSTKPLKAVLGMSIINKNITNANPRSTIIQITADGDTLTLNTQATSLKTEARIQGHGEGEAATFIASCGIFKQLISSINTSTIGLEFTEHNLTIKAGKSSFTLNASSEYDNMSLASPIIPTDDEVESAELLNVAKWKFIQDHQLYALAKTFEPSPAFTRIYNGANGDVIVGDFSNSLFTHTGGLNLGIDCLLTVYVVNLVASMPETAKLVKSGSDFVIAIKTDSYDYYTQIEPKADEASAYPASDILGLMQALDNESITVDVAEITNALSQSQLLNSDNDRKIVMEIRGESINLIDSNVDCEITGVGEISEERSCRMTFGVDILRTAISKCPGAKVEIIPTYDGEGPNGLLLISDDFSTILGCEEE